MMGSLLEEFRNVRQHLEGDISKIERVIADMEHQYIHAETSQPGTVLKGFEGFLSSKEALRKKARGFKTDERLFSLSSKTSPVTVDVQGAALEQVDGIQVPGISRKSSSYAQKGYAQKGYAEKGRR